MGFLDLLVRTLGQGPEMAGQLVILTWRGG